MKKEKKRYWIEHPIKDGNYWTIRYGFGDYPEGERITQGRSEYNAFEMAADAICSCLDIKMSWYRRLIFKIFRV